MTESIYKCEDHRLDLVCRGCVKAWIARHDKLLEFVKYVSQIKNDVLDEDAYILVLDGVIEEAKQELKEIGEL